MTGLLIDNFAGGGGASTGIEAAMGRPVDVAINHDEAAIAVHSANHPDTRHYCQSIYSVDPLDATGGEPVLLAWFSPDCKHHSKAKGGKPREKYIRDMAHVVPHWIERLMKATPDGRGAPQVIMLENVEEFRHWGPLVAKRDKATGRVLKTVEYLDKKGKARTRTEVAAPGERVPVERQLLVPDPDGYLVRLSEPQLPDPLDD